MGGYLYAGSGSSVSLTSNKTGDTLATNSICQADDRLIRKYQLPPRVDAGIALEYRCRRLASRSSRGERAVCPAASRATAAGGCGLNQDMVMAKVNLIWAPVAFADFGLEYTMASAGSSAVSSGAENVIVNRMRLRF